MALGSKHRRIKRATVLIKRTRCIRNTKSKNYPPLYHKLKVNNHSLARALSQEKQENQLLFSRNVELSAEVQDLVHACNNRDLVITNILKNSKDMMQTLVTMSGYLANTISVCQEYASNQNNIHRSSTSNTSRRESVRRMSTKSPARGVVKPMVSGHTITKPTINLSRVNMQRLQNVNLSIIEEGPATPERSIENRCSRTLPERVPVLRTEDDEERVVVNRRTSRFSGGRLSSGRYSKRNSGRLSGGGLSSRLSKRSSEFNELIKSPRVTLQDVSRYLPNNQSVNVRTLSENSRINSRANNTTSIEDTRMSDQSSPERSSGTIIPETQVQSSDSSDSEQETINTVCQRSKNSSLKSSRNSEKPQPSRSTVFESTFDPQEGPSWLFDSTDEETSTVMQTTVVNSESTEEQHEPVSSPVSSLGGERRRTSHSFRVPALPKSFSKTRHNVSVGNSTAPLEGDITNRFPSNGVIGNCDNNDDDDDDVDDQRVNFNKFITHRRGPSSRVASLRGVVSDDDDEDDETLMLNIQRQLQPQEPADQPEGLQFDLNELLQLTPLKPLLNKNNGTSNGPVQIDDAPEHTATVQLTQRCMRPPEEVETMSQLTTIKMHQNIRPDLPSPITVRGQELNAGGSQDKRLSELTTLRLSSRIELPRLTDVLNFSDDNRQQSQMILTPENKKQLEIQKRKRMVTKPTETQSANEENEEELPVQRKKKPKQRKKPSKDKDPSTAQVVLQKLDGTSRTSSQSENARSDRKNSDESISSVRSSRQDLSSDSESSTTSSSKQIPIRPRRQKAPKNLQEPSLSKKLRR